jgi:hypothetical protein
MLESSTEISHMESNRDVTVTFFRDLTNQNRANYLVLEGKSILNRLCCLSIKETSMVSWRLDHKFMADLMGFTLW